MTTFNDVVPWTQWIKEAAEKPFLLDSENQDWIKSIQLDAYQKGFSAGQETCMKWVGEECKRQTERIVTLKYGTNPPTTG